MPVTTLIIPVNWNKNYNFQRETQFKILDKFVINDDYQKKKGIKKEEFSFEITEKDEDILELFAFAEVSKKCLYELQSHTKVIYVSAETKDMDSAMALAEAGNAILKSGGISLIAETSGLNVKNKLQSNFRNNVMKTIYTGRRLRYSVCLLPKKKMKKKTILKNMASTFLSTKMY